MKKLALFFCTSALDKHSIYLFGAAAKQYDVIMYNTQVNYQGANQQGGKGQRM